MPLQIVPIGKALTADDIAAELAAFAVRAADGEFETVYILAIKPDGSWQTRELGEKPDRLRMIGLLECLKTDIIAATEVER